MSPSAKTSNQPSKRPAPDPDTSRKPWLLDHDSPTPLVHQPDGSDGGGVERNQTSSSEVEYCPHRAYWLIVSKEIHEQPANLVLGECDAEIVQAFVILGDVDEKWRDRFDFSGIGDPAGVEPP